VINIKINQDWVAAQCTAGYHLQFTQYPDKTHMGLLEASSPLTDDLIAWTADRLAERPPNPTC
jgi:hypothetical protein